MNHPIRVLVTLALTVLAGCATAPSGGSSAGKGAHGTLEERAVQRWQLLIAHKAEEAYAYLTPGFRATKSQADYARENNNRPVQWKSVQFLDKDCQEDSCTVRLTVDYTLPIQGVPNAKGFGVLEEKWIKVSGGWYYLQGQFGSAVSNN